MKSPILRLNDVTISFLKEKTWHPIVKNIDFDVYENEILGIVGESGSGKSVTSLAIIGLLPKSISQISKGHILYNNKELNKLTEKEFAKLRGREISMIFQDPMTALNPSMKCGKQVAEVLQKHTTLSEKEIKKEVLSLFEKVKLPEPEELYYKYPHQISGGQKQRVMIAMAVACKPKILIADEPTTALDVTVQKEIIALLKELQATTEMSVIFISHDLSLVSEIAHRVLVMYKGEIVEQNTTAQIFNSPQRSYTKALIASRPSLDYRLKKLPTIQDIFRGNFSPEIETKEERSKRQQAMYSLPPLLEVKNLEKVYYSNVGLFGRKKAFKAIDNIHLKIYEGETMGLVGESGCGKSTLGNAILLLDKASAGEIFYKGKDITKLNKTEELQLRKELQIIFQDPYSSLNPRITVGNAIMEPMRVHGLYKDDSERRKKAIEILECVGLGEEHFDRYPHEFSGGQRQRVGIARTIALQPKLIVCDESVSALDISVQAQVLNLLNELQETLGFTYLFISHDLAVVKYMADQIAVMNKGKIVELNDADAIYQNPESPYTQKLIDAIPKGTY